jgi:hypothetical protein
MVLGKVKRRKESVRGHPFLLRAFFDMADVEIHNFKAILVLFKEARDVSLSTN